MQNDLGQLEPLENPNNKSADFLCIRQLKEKTFPTKSQGLAVTISFFGGFLALHDFYLKLYKRGVIKSILLVITIIFSSVLFWTVEKEMAISYSFIFQSLLIMPLLASVIWWVYDVVIIIKKRSKCFIQKYSKSDYTKMRMNDYTNKQDKKNSRKK